MTRQKLEIMAPAGNFECLHAAIQGGADSVYFGVEKLNMRSHSANNFKMTDLEEIVRICSEYGVKTYLTLNIVLYDSDLEDMRRTLEAAKAAGITAVIASDMEIMCGILIIKKTDLIYEIQRILPHFILQYSTSWIKYIDQTSHIIKLNLPGKGIFSRTTSYVIVRSDIFSL